MSKYKCLNPDCNHEFIADEWLFECPKCLGTEFVRIDKKFPKFIWWIVGGIAAIIFIAIIWPPNVTNVDVDYKESSQQLTVKLTGDGIDKYDIVIKRDGNDFDSKKKPKYSRVFETPGTYSIVVTWKGKDKMPKQTWNGTRSFTIDEPVKEKVVPLILDAKTAATDVKKQLYLTVSVVSDTSLVKVSETEFSKDSGNTYQKSNVFTNLSPGTYTFYARNANDKSKVSEKFEKILKPIKKESPSDAVLNDLLRKIAKGSESAYDNWRDNVGGAEISVSVGITGITNSIQLIDYVNTTGTYISVKTQRNSDNKITKITR